MSPTTDESVMFAVNPASWMETLRESPVTPIAVCPEKILTAAPVVPSTLTRDTLPVTLTASLVALRPAMIPPVTFSPSGPAAVTPIVPWTVTPSAPFVEPATLRNCVPKFAMPN